MITEGGYARGRVETKESRRRCGWSMVCGTAAAMTRIVATLIVRDIDGPWHCRSRDMVARDVDGPWHRRCGDARRVPPWRRRASDRRDAAAATLVRGNREVATRIVHESNDARPQVLGFEANGNYSDFEKRMLPIVVDPDVIFGSDTTLRVPKGFVGSSVDALAAADEVKVSKTPCAFALAKKSLAAGEGVTIVSVYGHAKSVEQITEDIAPKIMSELYITKKYPRRRPRRAAAVPVRGERADAGTTRPSR